MKYKREKRFIFQPTHWFKIKVGWEHPTDPHLTRIWKSYFQEQGAWLRKGYKMGN